MRSYNYPKAAGFSIIEVLVGLGLITLIMSGMLTFFRFMSAADRGTWQRAEARDLRVELRALMNDQNTCTYNLTNNVLGAIQLAPAATEKFSGISYVTTNPATGQVQGVTPYFLQPGVNFRGANSIMVSMIQLYYKAKLGNLPVPPSPPPPPPPSPPPAPPPDPTSLHAFDIVVTVQRTQAVVGAQAISLRIPLIAVVDNVTQKIEGCYTSVLSINEASYENAMCSISSNGSTYWVPNPAGGGSCQPLCFNGPSSTNVLGQTMQASCPAGYPENKCMSGGNVASPVVTPPRSYAGPSGSTLTLGGPAFPLYPANYGAVPPSTCTCSFFPNDVVNPNAHMPASTPLTANCIACCTSFNMNTGTFP